MIPVAGLGTRLLPITRAVAKELLPIGPKPTLHWIGEELAQLGVEHLCLVTSPEKADIDQLFRANRNLEEGLERQGQTSRLKTLWSRGAFASTRVSTAIQLEQRGLGDAVLHGQSQLEPGPFVLALGDCIMGPPGKSQLTQRLLRAFEEQQADAAIAFEEVPPDKVSRYGIADPDGNADPGAESDWFPLRDLVEKPEPQNAPSNLAIAARYVLSDEIFEFLKTQSPGVGGEIQLTDSLRRMLQAGRKVIGVRLRPGESRVDVGNYTTYAKAFIEFAIRNDPELKRWATTCLREEG